MEALVHPQRSSSPLKTTSPWMVGCSSSEDRRTPLTVPVWWGGFRGFALPRILPIATRLIRRWPAIENGHKVHITRECGNQWFFLGVFESRDSQKRNNGPFMLRANVAGWEGRVRWSDIAAGSRFVQFVAAGGQILAGVHFVPCRPGRGHTGDEEDRGRVDDGGKIIQSSSSALSLSSPTPVRFP